MRYHEAVLSAVGMTKQIRIPLPLKFCISRAALTAVLIPLPFNFVELGARKKISKKGL